MSDEIAQVERVYRRYFAEFQTRNTRAIVPYFCLPSVFVSSAGVVALQTSMQAEAFFERMLHGLLARGYARSELRELQVKILGASIAVIHVRGARYRDSGELLEELAALYTLHKSEDGTWRIAVATTFEPERELTLS